MDAIQLLLDQARTRRDTAILEAKREYHYALRQIQELNRKLRLREPAKPRKIPPICSGADASRSRTSSGAVLCDSPRTAKSIPPGMVVQLSDRRT
jgi:hypothetical protein